MDEKAIDAIVLAGQKSATAQERIHVVVSDGGVGLIYVTDLNGKVRLDTDAMKYVEQRQPFAVRPKESVVFHDAESLCAYVKRFRSERASLWCNVDEPAIVVVLDEHAHDVPAVTHNQAMVAMVGGDNPDEKILAGHRQWRAIHKPEHSYPWKAWSKLFTQSHVQQETLVDQFEENIRDVCKVDDLPSGIELLNLAKSLEIYSKGTFKKEINPQTGERMLVCQEEHQQGSTRIPPEFNLRMPIFEGDAAYDVRVRLTFRLVDGKPRFTLRVPRKGELVTDALRKLGERVAQTLEMQLHMGAPG